MFLEGARQFVKSELRMLGPNNKMRVRLHDKYGIKHRALVSWYGRLPLIEMVVCFARLRCVSVWYDWRTPLIKLFYH